MVLDFAEEATALRGMTRFPDDIPFYDTTYGEVVLEGMPYGFWISGGVMRSLPVIPGVTSINTDIKTYVKSIKNKKLYGFGFPLGVEDAYITEDGIYIRYSIEEDERKVGQIEYYYSIKEKKFSYREIVSPMLTPNAGDNVFLFELFDVPVTKGSKGLSFKAGELYDNGSIFSFYDVVLAHNHEGLESINSVSLVQEGMHMKYDSNAVDAASIWESTVDNIQLSREVDISDNADCMNYDETFELLGMLFEGGFFKNRERFKTIDDFNSTAVSFKNHDNDELKIEKCLCYPSSFNLKEKKAAAVYSSQVKNIFMQWNFPEVAVKAFKDCGYNISEVYVETPEEEKVKIMDDFIVSLFEKLDFSKAIIDDRRNIVKDSYPEA